MEIHGNLFMNLPWNLAEFDRSRDWKSLKIIVPWRLEPSRACAHRRTPPQCRSARGSRHRWPRGQQNTYHISLYMYISHIMTEEKTGVLEKVLDALDIHNNIFIYPCDSLCVCAHVCAYTYLVIPIGIRPWSYCVKARGLVLSRWAHFWRTMSAACLAWQQNVSRRLG